MSISKVDSKKRIVLNNGRPGDMFNVQELADGQYLLVRLEAPEPAGSISKEDCLRAMDSAPLHSSMSWDELRSLTRDL